MTESNKKSCNSIKFNRARIMAVKNGEVVKNFDIFLLKTLYFPDAY